MVASVAASVANAARRSVPCSRSVFTLLPIAWTVASWPALSRRMQVAINSSSDRRSPVASAASRRVIRSSAGRFRRSAT